MAKNRQRSNTTDVYEYAAAPDTGDIAHEVIKYFAVARQVARLGAYFRDVVSDDGLRNMRSVRR
ncbi:MAG: hypothetical protein Q7S71_04135 [Candidatus Nitrotoga sp.]|nr:hypothetical protein [Candidatus Nitrotoga sp.]